VLLGRRSDADRVLPRVDRVLTANVSDTTGSAHGIVVARQMACEVPLLGRWSRCGPKGLQGLARNDVASDIAGVAK
jgi:hypothetical protein